MNTIESVRASAEAATARWPQYRGYWNGEEWKLVQFRRRVRTKMGVAFDVGDVTIARVDERERDSDACRDGSPSYVTAWSVRNSINTQVRMEDVSWL